MKQSLDFNLDFSQNLKK